MSSAADSKAYRERRKNGGRRVEDGDQYVMALLDQIADLKAQLSEAHKRDVLRDGLLRHVTENFVTVTRHVTEKLTSIAAGFGGKGGSGSGSPSPSGSSEKEREDREFQDLNGETRERASGTQAIANPVTVGDASRDGESVTGTVTVTRHVTESSDAEPASIFDSQRAETSLRRKPLRDTEMAAKAASETRRLEAVMGGKP